MTDGELTTQRECDGSCGSGGTAQPWRNMNGGQDEDYHIDTPASQNPHGVPNYQTISAWLLLDSRVVDVLMASNPTFAMLSSVKPLFFNRLKK